MGNTLSDEQLKTLISSARGEVKADLVLKNAKIFNVFTGDTEEGDVAVSGGHIAGIGRYEGKEEIDIGGRVICPGLIDSHIHIESSVMTPAEFAKSVIPHGTVAVVTDPHEIANVAGEDGISFMLEHVPTSVPMVSNRSMMQNVMISVMTVSHPMLTKPAKSSFKRVVSAMSLKGGTNDAVLRLSKGLILKNAASPAQ